jgi:malate synthase
VQQTILITEIFQHSLKKQDIRTSNWTVLVFRMLCRRDVEITGPVDRKMIINALNSGAKLLWLTLKTALHLHGKILLRVKKNLIDANKTISLTDTLRNKSYALNDVAVC